MDNETAKPSERDKSIAYDIHTKLDLCGFVSSKDEASEQDVKEAKKANIEMIATAIAQERERLLEKLKIEQHNLTNEEGWVRASELEELIESISEMRGEKS